jgi:hypothetical protein
MKYKTLASHWPWTSLWSPRGIPGGRGPEACINIETEEKLITLRPVRGTYKTEEKLVDKVSRHGHKQYLHIYIFAYLHIYIFTYLCMSARV